MARRGAGEGTITKNEARGRWEGRLTVGYSTTGKRVRRKVTGRTRNEVVGKLRDLQTAAGQGMSLVSDNVTVSAFLEDWLNNILPGTVSKATEAQYRQIADLYVIPALGRKRLRTLQPRDVTMMLRDMAKRGLSANTQRLARAVLRRAIRWAETNGSVARNVAALADPPKGKASDGKALTVIEARAVLAAARRPPKGTKAEQLDPTKSHRLEAAFTVALSLGLRRSELLGLAWSDLDLDGTPPRLTVRRGLKRHKGAGMALEDLKTARSRRTINLPEPVVASLRRHKVRQAEERLAAGDLWRACPDDADLVFRTATGEAIDPNNFGRAVRKLCEDAGIPGTWSPHSLRHSAASLLLAQGVPLKVISDILGHSSISVTADIYAHLVDEAKTEAAEAMTAALWSELA